MPVEIRSALGKREILKSLRTSNFHDAKRAVAYESAIADALFERERAKLKSISSPRREPPPLSEADVHRLVVRWFIGEEKKSEEWWEQRGQFMDAIESRGLSGSSPGALGITTRGVS